MNENEQALPVKTEERVPQGLTAEGMFKKYELSIKKALPKYVNGDKLLKMAISSIQRNPMLLKCHPATLVGGFIQASLLNLQLDGVTGQAYLVPFWNSKKNRYDAQFMVGYKGLRKLVENSGKVVTFIPQVVYEGDIFEYNLAEARISKHERTEKTDPTKPVMFYSLVRYESGSIEQLIMSIKEVDEIRDRHSKTYQKSKKDQRSDSIWQQHYEAMGMKTVMRRHAKYLPLAVGDQNAVVLDEYAESGVPQDLGLLADNSETPTLQDEVAEEIPMPERTSERNSDGPKKEQTAPIDAENESPQHKEGTRRFKSKFDGTCIVCDGSIAKGEECVYSPTSKKVWHTGCDAE